MALNMYLADTFKLSYYTTSVDGCELIINPCDIWQQYPGLILIAILRHFIVDNFHPRDFQGQVDA